MKKTFLTVAATLACVAAFAQGRVSFTTDSNHLVYYDPSVGGALGGTAVSAGNLPAGVTLVADLYMGTSSSSLNLYSSSSFSTTPGKWNTVLTTANTPPQSIPGGTQVFIVTQIRDQAFAAPSQWTSATAPFGTYYGVSQEFQFTLGTSSLNYPVMYATGASLGGGFSTWANGTFALDSSAGAGTKGAIAVSSLAVTPEPAQWRWLASGPPR
jgi:hypothetical protein